jgi:hypothetical protein
MGRRLTSGVNYYTVGKATFNVPFPEDWCVYGQCPYITRKYGVGWECLLTQEHILYPDECRGNQCPVEFEEEPNNERD